MGVTHYKITHDNTPQSAGFTQTVQKTMQTVQNHVTALFENKAGDLNQSKCMITVKNQQCKSLSSRMKSLYYLVLYERYFMPLALMRGFKYSRNAIHEKIIDLNQHTHCKIPIQIAMHYSCF